MALDLVSLLGSVENLLIKNNTTTSGNDISSGLNERVVTFNKGVGGLHETIPIPETQYPAVLVELQNKVEEFAQVGNSANRNMDIGIDIVPVISYGMGSSSVAKDSVETSNLELVRLTQNIEKLIRANINLSNTVDDTNINNTDYNVRLNDNTTYNGVAIISLSVRTLET